jgi:hypothetical protein
VGEDDEDDAGGRPRRAAAAVGRAAGDREARQGEREGEPVGLVAEVLEEPRRGSLLSSASFIARADAWIRSMNSASLGW